MDQTNYTTKNKRSLSQSSQYYTNSKLSCEEIINKMENEQDAIVVRLLREINYLKQENTKLRNQLNNNRRKFRRHSTGTSSASTNNIDDEVIIDDDDTNNNMEELLPLTPRRSFNNGSTYTTPISSRRPSNVNSNTIFPIHTPASSSSSSSSSSANINSITGNFLRPKKFTFSHIPSSSNGSTIVSSSSSAVGIENLSINHYNHNNHTNNRKRRTSSTLSLENNPHFKNHEKKVNEILPLR
ncbi:similar to Saccharomyces cerevisiae YGR161C RTS3 Putative component of the protein phosphatase type 2A complex [Maudiozyma barnettii]|uniref:Similar to Saccharomyces cerevisiae YGR161C RTS3 Putative component of the protein phosphatase type 2A complex n=1 Tax=Maudiozyma barnettii TaxID=61262 RepID=A0A8H2VJ19_9SACH|nr:Rts3p [Kazachstania barnettii]CAB4256646.1 similar to Saccharomyces cerevisiae YGR161C RTS3 Putative component of the protein phosphatase type 2A complex [Kazachstania barnettii]CAD1785249.1 similar to Saccharomyces cerevisiae YGR161C RTS3 Putative component of the protein phosphatase type 2A complex [Kazachstania barnettii]